MVFEDDEDIMSSVVVKLLKERIDSGVATDAKDDIDYVKIIKKYDASYESPKNQTTEDINKRLQNQTPTQPSNGCYVATCVYGSYDCPQVWTLWRYCDYKLAETLYSRVFIRVYYAISPKLVKWFGNTS